MGINEALAQFLRTHFSCNIDSEKLLGHVHGLIDEVWELTKAFEWLTSEADEVSGFSIRPAFVLTNFAYAKLPMVRDLEAAVEVIEQHDLIAALAGDADARSAILSLSSNENDVPSPDDVPLADEFVVLDADASQTYAINSVLGGHNLIVKGPPGTGKSQTIANLIATLLARRKRVLFVAEKRAAIDAVLKRLTPLGLGQLVLDLHRSGTTRRAFASTIAHALDVIRSVPAIDTSQLDSQVETMRAELNHYVEELHQIRDPWGSSIYDFRAELLGIPTEPTARLPFSPDLLQRLSAAQQRAYEAEIAELAALGGFRLNRGGTGWAKARVESDDEARAAWSCPVKWWRFRSAILAPHAI